MNILLVRLRALFIEKRRPVACRGVDKIRLWGPLRSLGESSWAFAPFRLTWKESDMTTATETRGPRPWLVLALVVSLAALGGSLALSLGLNLRACPLCFYQRTF